VFRPSFQLRSITSLLGMRMPGQQTMNSTMFTILDEGRPWTGGVSQEGDSLWLSHEALRSATGWEMKPQGLCRDDVCIPVGSQPQLIRNGLVNLSAFADLLRRPLVVDHSARAAYLGTSSQARSDRLSSLEAPDFELPDLSGRMHRLSDHRGRKVLLVAYASW